eukprot:g30560.t1
MLSQGWRSACELGELRPGLAPLLCLVGLGSGLLIYLTAQAHDVTRSSLVWFSCMLTGGLRAIAQLRTTAPQSEDALLVTVLIFSCLLGCAGGDRPSSAVHPAPGLWPDGLARERLERAQLCPVRREGSYLEGRWRGRLGVTNAGWPYARCA